MHQVRTKQPPQKSRSHGAAASNWCMQLTGWAAGAAPPAALAWEAAAGGWVAGAWAGAEGTGAAVGTAGEVVLAAGRVACRQVDGTLNALMSRWGGVSCQV